MIFHSFNHIVQRLTMLAGLEHYNIPVQPPLLFRKMVMKIIILHCRQYVMSCMCCHIIIMCELIGVSCMYEHTTKSGPAI